jgi:hypothetical protein
MPLKLAISAINGDRKAQPKGIHPSENADIFKFLFVYSSQLIAFS